MIFKKLSKIGFIAILSFAASAHAELQTWRLTSTTYRIQDGFAPPSFGKIGTDFYIDYVIDSLTPGWGGMFSGAVKSFTVNGITSQSGGYILAYSGLNALNIWPSAARIDNIDFISFNNFAGTSNASVISALDDFSVSAKTSSTDLRIDFGSKSISAKPSSFVMLSVPEPSSVWLFLIGAPLLLLKKFRQQTA